MNDFPKNFELELGAYVEKFIKWLMTDYGAFFDSIRDGMLWFLIEIEKLLKLMPWWLVIILVFLAGWKLLRLENGIIYAGLMFAIGCLGLWDLMMITLAVVLTSVFISIAIGIPIGILMSSSERAEMVIKPILDAMQTMPSFVYLIPAIMLFGLGKVPAVFATTIYAIVPVIRLTNLGIRQVSKESVEVADSFGSTYMQKLLKVQIPQAIPSIATGINQTTMMALGMVVTASMIGAKGLGMEVLQAIGRIDIAKGFDAGVSVVFLAITIDRLSQAMANNSTKKRLS